MSAPDLLHDETAELARLQAENAELRHQLDESRALAEAIRTWFAEGGPDEHDERDRLVRAVCEQVLTDRAEPAPVTAVAVALVESWPSGASDSHLAAAAVACRQVVTFAELAQARLTRELAWRYETRHGEELDLDLDARVPEWIRDREQRALTAAVAEVAALSRLSPGVLRDRVDMVATYPEEHPVLFRALLTGTVSTTRARLIARESERLPGLRERSWVETQILPVAERMGQAALRSRLEKLIAQADPARYRELLDEAADEPDTVAVRQQGYGRAALTYSGSLTQVTELHAALTHHAAVAHAGTRDRGIALAAALVDLVTEPAAVAPGVPAPRSESSPTTESSPPAAARPAPTVQLNVTIPFQVLLAIWAGRATPTAFGLIEVDGHGPIPARALASVLLDHGARATWRCQVVNDDPESPTYGSILGVGRAAVDPTYRPSASVAALVRAARPHCVFPGCRRRAAGCDLDHVVPHAAGGPTAEANLVPLCRFHHLLKTHLRFLPGVDPRTGEVTWRTPGGFESGEPPDAPPPLDRDGDLPGAWPAPPAGEEPPPF